MRSLWASARSDPCGPLGSHRRSVRTRAIDRGPVDDPPQQVVEHCDLGGLEALEQLLHHAHRHGGRLPHPLAALRRLFLALAGLDIVALVLFLAVRALDPGSFADYVASSPLYAGMVKSEGLDSAVTYATLSTTIIHLAITAVFLWLARSIVRGSRATRVRAAVVLVISGAFNIVAALSPLGGLLQLAVMGTAVVLKVTALFLLVRYARDSSAGDHQELAASAR